MADFIDPSEVHVPRTDAETDSSIGDRLKRYRRQFVVGYVILALGILGAFQANNHEVCESRSQNVAQITDTIGGILQRLDDANKVQYTKGIITYDERQTAHAFYQGELDKLPVSVDCTLL